MVLLEALHHLTNREARRNVVAENIQVQTNVPKTIPHQLRTEKKTRSTLLLCALVAFFFLLAVFSVRNQSATGDETWHVATGLIFLRTGDLRANTEHPYPPNALSALPLALNKNIAIPSVKDTRFRNAQPSLLSEKTAEMNGGVISRGIYTFRSDILFLPRVMMISAAALFLLAYGLLIRHEFGGRVGILAVILLGFSPTFLAHGSLATTDVPAAATIFLASFLLWLAHRARTRRAYLILFFSFIAASFLALMAKYTTLLVAPIWLVFAGYSVFVRSASYRLPLRVLLAVGAALGILAFWLYALYAAYGFQFMTLQQTKHGDSAVIREEKELLAQKGGEKLVDFYTRFPLPFPYYARGVMFNMVFKNILGHESFFLGKYEQTGHWYYPVAFLVKETVPFVIASMCFVLWALARLIRTRRVDDTFFLWVPALVIALAFTFSNVKIGIRHVLPVYPFLALGVAVAMDRCMTNPLRRGVVSVAMVFILVIAVTVHPQYLSYFNVFAGGSANGYKWLHDSNYDWGQNELLAKRIVEKSGSTIHYEGTDLPQPGMHYLIRLAELYARLRDRDERETALRELLEQGKLQVVDKSLPTHWVVYYPPKESVTEKDAAPPRR